MIVITAPEEYKTGCTEQLNVPEIRCFLAGGISKCPDWQQKVINRLRNYEVDKLNKDDNFNGLVLFNPRRDNFNINDPSATATQIAWEYENLQKMDIFSMYFARSESDQPICMYELGKYIERMKRRYPTNWWKRIVVSVEDGYSRKEDVIYQLSLDTGYVENILHTHATPEDHAYRIRHLYKVVTGEKI